MKRIIAVLVLLLLCLPAASAEIGDMLGQTMPDFTVETSDGETLTLSGLLEKKDVVVLNIFTSWCPPCEAEFPEMERVYRDLSDRMEIVAVSAEPDDTLGVIADYKARLGLSFPMGLWKDLRALVPFDGYPTTLIIDSTGKVGFTQFGAFINSEDFREVVSWYLARGYDGTPAGVYRVFVCDQYGQTVPGVTVEFCDAACQVYTTDANGMILFTGKPARYSLHIKSVPKGYSFDPDYETVCDSSGEWAGFMVMKD